MSCLDPQGLPVEDGDLEPPPVAVIVVRAWWESDEPHTFRARIWRSPHLPEQPLQSRLVASPEELDEEVNRWRRQMRKSRGCRAGQPRTVT